jgi:hypothetical protein
MSPNVLDTVGMNERLRTTMLQRGVSIEDLAEACAVDQKTVGRWINPGRTPHRQHRWITTRLLEADEVYLWPGLLDRDKKRINDVTQSELIEMFPNRAAISRDTWNRLLAQSCSQIDVLVFSGTFFAQTPRISKMLTERAAAGVCVRLCFGNPASSAVDVRDREEGLRGTLSAKIRASLTYYHDLLDTPGCEIRLHSTTLYASLFRYDDNLIVNPHVWGQPASTNPVMHLRRLGGAGWFEHYMTSFEDIWNSAEPWKPTEGD